MKSLHTFKLSNNRIIIHSPLKWKLVRQCELQTKSFHELQRQLIYFIRQSAFKENAIHNLRTNIEFAFSENGSSEKYKCSPTHESRWSTIYPPHRAFLLLQHPLYEFLHRMPRTVVRLNGYQNSQFSYPAELLEHGC